MRVAVVGAGPAGLVTARYLKDCVAELDVYERRNTIGGVWRDRDESVNNSDEDIVALSPIYDTLRALAPIDTMKFEELDHEGEQDCFIPWQELNKYMKKYADKFGLMQYILLQTEVIKVSLDNGDWKVRSRHLPGGEVVEKAYNTLIICTGHEEIPFIPQIEGVSSFQGPQFHSKKYRNPEKFRNQNVLIIGLGASGADIALQISSTAKTIYLSHHRQALGKAKFAPNIYQKPDVKKFTKDSVIFQDDSVAVVDVVIYCTGYEYNYKYFDESYKVTLGDKYVKNLYKNMISIEHPNLIFCGLLREFFVFALMEHQAKFVAKVLTGKVILPTKEEMLEDTKKWEQKYRSQGIEERQFYDLKSNGREYMLELSRVGSLPKPPEALFEMFDVFYPNFVNEPATFRKHIYKIINSKFVYERCST